MGKQEFGVVFNVDPHADPFRPVGTIDGFKQKGRAREDGLVSPPQMKDVLDDSMSIYIRGQEYVLDETGCVIGVEEAERIAELAEGGMPVEIGQGVFIASGVQFRSREESLGASAAGYHIADGAAIGHRFQFDMAHIHMEDIGASKGCLPFSEPPEAEKAVAEALAYSGKSLSLGPGLVVGESAVIWSAAKRAIPSRLGDQIHVGDRAQVFAQGIGAMTAIAADTIVDLSRGLIGANRAFGPGGEWERTSNDNERSRV